MAPKGLKPQIYRGRRTVDWWGSRMTLSLFAIPLFLLLLAIPLRQVASGMGRGPRYLRGIFFGAGPVLLLGLWVKPAGPLWWFGMPGWAFNRYLNWPLLVVWALFIPLRNLVHMAHQFSENRRLTSESREAPKPFRDWLGDRQFPEASLAAGLRNPPQIMLHPSLTHPRTLGLRNALAWHDVILLPSSWVPKELMDDSPYWESFRLLRPASAVRSEDAIFAALLHELGHILGGDTFAGLLTLLGTFAFPHEWQPGSIPSNRSEITDRLKHWTSILGRPISKILDADLDGRERRADAFAASLMPNAIGLLQEELGVSERGPKGRETPLAVVLLSSIVFLMVLGAAWKVVPGSAAVARSLGGRGAINGSLPSGWEVVQWDAPRHEKQPATGSWRYVPASRSEPPRVHLEQEDEAHVLLFMSAIDLPKPLKGPATVRMEWVFDLERGSLDKSFDLQLTANDLGEGEGGDGTIKSIFLAFATRKVTDFERIGPSRYRLVRELPIPSGLEVRVLHCIWAVTKSASVLLSPPKVQVTDPTGHMVRVGG